MYGWYVKIMEVFLEMPKYAKIIYKMRKLAIISMK